MGTQEAMLRSVDYGPLDEFKIGAQWAAAKTSPNAERFGMKFLEWTRGESVQVFENPTYYEGRVLEGLGTKVLVAIALRALIRIGAAMSFTGRTWFDNIARCTYATMANDMITLGILPTDCRLYVAVGSAVCFKDRQGYQDLIDGWEKVCNATHCVWTGGETPQLSDIICPDAVDLSGSMSGRSIGRCIFDPSTIRAGDAIVVAESSGIHANGLTDARAIAKDLPQGYLTEVVLGKTFGDMLLRPTHLYCDLVEECIRKEIRVRYCVNITGHGWRKFMRALQPFTYVIDELPTNDPIFDFIQEHGRIDGKQFDDEKMYGTFNMGAGFALFIREADLPRFYRLVVNDQKWPFRIFTAGHIEAGKKRVIISPKDNLTFEEESLQIR